MPRESRGFNFMIDITSSVDTSNPQWYLVPVGSQYANYVPFVVFESTETIDPDNSDYYSANLSGVTIMPPTGVGMSYVTHKKVEDTISSYTTTHFYCRTQNFSFGVENDDHHSYFNLSDDSGNTIATISGVYGSTSFEYASMIIVPVIHTANNYYFTSDIINASSNPNGEADQPTINAASTNHKGFTDYTHSYYVGFLTTANKTSSAITSNSTTIARLIEKNGKPIDSNDPDSGTPSGGGGGGQNGDIGGDSNGDDGLPTLSGMSTGLYTVYNPSSDNLQSLGDFLWSDNFDVNTFKKLFTDPFDVIMGLSIIPIQPHISSSTTIKFGNIDTGITASVVSDQWQSVDMGSVTLSEITGSAMDYDPFTQVSIYLPFIGFRQLNITDVMASTLSLIYKFDILTGSVIAQLYVNHNLRGNTVGDAASWTTDEGFLYSFEGQCAVNLPLNSQDFTNTIRAAISAVGMVAGAAASVATGNPALGVAALATGAVNSTIQASTPVIERSGHLSASHGLLDYMQPMLVVIRPHRAKPSHYYDLRGLPSQVYVSLANCSGYTEIADNQVLHVSGATHQEIDEINTLLKRGAYF